MARTDSPSRLKRRRDFLAAKKGERRKGPFFVLEVRDRLEQPPDAARVGFTVTRRQGNAVERNRIRRRLREAARTSAFASFEPGCDYVVLARRDALHASFSRLTAALKDRIERHRARTEPSNRP